MAMPPDDLTPSRLTGLSEAEAARRALELRFLVDGLTVRAVREPRIDRAALRAAIENLIARILA